MTSIELRAADRDLVTELLDRERQRLPVEIRRTETRAYRVQLRKRFDQIEELAQHLAEEDRTMTTLDRLQTFLIRMNCRFDHDRHELAYTAREVAHAEHLPERTFAKTVVVHSENGYAMCVAPADTKIDLEQLRLSFGFQRLRLATEGELEELFPHCELGAMPPFGNGTLFELPVYADARVMHLDEIAFNAGTHRDVVRMKATEWQALVRPSMVEIATQRRG